MSLASRNGFRGRCALRGQNAAHKTRVQPGPPRDALVQTGYFGAPAATSSPNEAMAAYVLYDLRAHVLGQTAVSAYATMAEEACRKVFVIFEPK